MRRCDVEPVMTSPRVMTSRVWPAPERTSPSARLVVSVVEGLGGWMGGWVDERFGWYPCCFTLCFATRRTLVVRVLPDDRQGIERAEGRRTAAIRPCSQCRVPVSPFVKASYRFLFCVCALILVIELRRSKSNA